MSLSTAAADAIGVVTIALLSVVVVLGIACIYRSFYFQIWIGRRGYLQLSYFNGPWLTRIALSVVAIWWSLGEIVRLTLLDGVGKLFSDQTEKMDVCNFYVISNLGVAEPCMYLLFVFLLYAALQTRESGTLNRKWNRKTIGLVTLLCSPSIALELVVVFARPGHAGDVLGGESRILKLLSRSYYTSSDGTVRCTYPLLSTFFLGAFYVILISSVTYIGSSMLALVINNGLRYRIYVLMLAVVLLLPLRALLLGFSVLPLPGNLPYELIVFMSFIALYICTLVGIVVLVHFPISDSLALGEQDDVEMEAMRITYDER